MNLIVKHIPMHSAWGRVDELKKPEAVVNSYSVEAGVVHDLVEFKIRVVELLESKVTLEIFDNQSVVANGGLVNPKIKYLKLL